MMDKSVRRIGPGRSTNEMEAGVGGDVPEVHVPPGVDRTKRVLRSTIIFMCVAGLLLVLLTAASAAPWPVEGSAGFVWGAGLVAIAIGYVLKSRNELSRAVIGWGLVLAIVGFFLPIVLNQLLNSDYLHRLHKLLGFVSAFVVFVAWITALRYRTRTRSSAM